MDTYFVILEFHLQAGFEDAALIVETQTGNLGHPLFEWLCLR